jgi:VWFA-related protein
MCSTLVLFSIVCSSAVSFGQPSIPAAVASRTISIDVVAAPRSGPPVAGLQQNDFTVFDSKIERPIASFRAFAGPQAPIQIVLVVDAVNVDYSAMAYEREQIDTFLRSNGGHLLHPVALAIFTDQGTEMQHGASTDGNQLSALLDRSVTGLRQIRRGSYGGGEDRFNLSIRALRILASTPASAAGRTIIFWISPGWPLLSGADIQLDNREEQQIFAQVVDLSTLLRRNDVTLYSIDPLGAGQDIAWENAYEQFLGGVKKAGQVNLGNLALQVLAVQSGGLALAASNDTVSRLKQCMADTVAYYRITYEAPPSEHADQYHPIAVRLSTPGLTARTRTGYYAQP